MTNPESSTQADELIALEDRWGAHNYLPLDVVVERASGATLTSRAFRNDQLPRFTEELARLCGMQMVLPMNTGAEAVETAIKAVRRWGYTRKSIPRDQAEVIVCEHNFHGRTTT